MHYEWSRDGAAPGTRSLEAVFVHELGHALGLDHPCGEEMPCSVDAMSDAVMYPDPVEAGRTPVLVPNRQEIDVLCDLYASR